MYTYSIFCIKSEIASHYFYKSDILYRFLKGYREKRSLSFIQLQYKYITEQITLDMLANYLQINKKQSVIEKREKYIRLFSNNKQLSVYGDERHLTLMCDSIEDAESYLFPAFRELPYYFFAINHRTNDYGWLTSFKMNEMISKQTLYSLQ